MRIGIDLDNTIIDYNYSFYYAALKENLINSKGPKNKIKIKRFINSKFGQNKWTELQGKVYGNYILAAKRYKYFTKFLDYINSKKISVYIISHKTKYPYLGKKINLHNSAKLWIAKNLKNKIDQKNIYFENSIESKIERIKKLKLDFFIDDLEKVLNHKKFPKDCKKILFGLNKDKKIISFLNWKLIEYYFKKNYIDNQIYFFYSEIKKKFKTNFEYKEINHKGNQKIFIIENYRTKFILKIYLKTKDSMSRFNKELYFYRFMKLNKNKSTPKLIYFNKNKYYLIIENIKTKKKLELSSKIKFVISFLSEINNYRLEKYKYRASESSNNIKKYIDLCNKKFEELKRTNFYIENKKLYLSINKLWKYKICPNLIKDYSDSYNLHPYNFNCLSPSDLSFKNILFNSNKAIFIDFEHAGKDDPVKLINDFIIQPRNKIPLKYYDTISKNMSEIFDETGVLKTRVFMFRNYFLIRWIFIILNIYLKKNLKRKIFSNNNLDFIKEKKLKTKLVKQILSKIK